MSSLNESRSSLDNLRIAITGIHAAGKTTLAQLLASKLSLPFVSTDPINIVAAFRYREKTWDVVSQEVFTYASYVLTSTVFKRFAKFVTDYDIAIQFAYIDCSSSMYEYCLRLMRSLPKYEVVVILHVKHPLTVIDRALKRLRWGPKMLSTAWLRRYYDFTCRVIERFYAQAVDKLRQRGLSVLELDAEARSPEELLDEVVLFLRHVVKLCE